MELQKVNFVMYILPQKKKKKRKMKGHENHEDEKIYQGGNAQASGTQERGHDLAIEVWER